MTLINCICVVSVVAAFAQSAHATDTKPLDEESFGEIALPPHRGGFGFDFGDAAFDSAFELPSHAINRDARRRFHERPLDINVDSGRSSSGRRGGNNNRNGRTNNGRSNTNRNNNNRDPTDTNEITNGDEDLMALLFRDDYNNKRIAFLRQQQRMDDIRNFYNVGEIRKKREASPDPGYPRIKRTCKKCGGGYGGGGYGGGGYGGGYPAAVPVYAVAVPVYSGGHGGYGGGGGYVPKPSYGGGYVQKPSYGGGCNTCGSPGYGGGGGGFGGSYSHSQSQSSSSSSSWGYGKK